MDKQSGSARVYHDIDGDPCTLRTLIKMEPEWAHSRITVMENELGQYQRNEAAEDSVREGLTEQLDQANQRIAELELGIGVVMSGEPMEITYCRAGNTIRVHKSNKQIQLEAQGCRFMGQELLDNHELDPNKPCQCGRPNKIGKQYKGE